MATFAITPVPVGAHPSFSSSWHGEGAATAYPMGPQFTAASHHMKGSDGSVPTNVGLSEDHRTVHVLVSGTRFSFDRNVFSQLKGLPWQRSVANGSVLTLGASPQAFEIVLNYLTFKTVQDANTISAGETEELETMAIQLGLTELAAQFQSNTARSGYGYLPSRSRSIKGVSSSAASNATEVNAMGNADIFKSNITTQPKIKDKSSFIPFMKVASFGNRRRTSSSTANSETSITWYPDEDSSSPSSPSRGNTVEMASAPDMKMGSIGAGGGRSKWNAAKAASEGKLRSLRNRIRSVSVSKLRPEASSATAFGDRSSNTKEEQCPKLSVRQLFRRDSMKGSNGGAASGYMSETCIAHDRSVEQAEEESFYSPSCGGGNGGSNMADAKRMFALPKSLTMTRRGSLSTHNAQPQELDHPEAVDRKRMIALPRSLSLTRRGSLNNSSHSQPQLNDLQDLRICHSNLD